MPEPDDAEDPRRSQPSRQRVVLFTSDNGPGPMTTIANEKNAGFVEWTKAR